MRDPDTPDRESALGGEILAPSGRSLPVLAVVYLVYNAGLNSPIEPSLCLEAIRLAPILVRLMPDDPEVAGLLALLLLTESRRASRLRPDGSLVLLGEQTAGSGKTSCSRSPQTR
jgi:predicted RNA polymerase sigma factor